MVTLREKQAETLCLGPYIDRRKILPFACRLHTHFYVVHRCAFELKRETGLFDCNAYSRTCETSLMRTDYFHPTP